MSPSMKQSLSFLESFFPSSQLQGESIQEAEDLELPPFPLLQNFVLRENDKDPMPTSLPKKNNEDSLGNNTNEGNKNPS